MNNSPRPPWIDARLAALPARPWRKIHLDFHNSHHIPRIGEEPSRPARRRGKARRWVVERTHSWMNRARRLLVRWEKTAANYLGFLHLQFAITTLRAAGVLG